MFKTIDPAELGDDVVVVLGNESLIPSTRNSEHAANSSKRTGSSSLFALSGGRERRPFARICVDKLQALTIVDCLSIDLRVVPITRFQNGAENEICSGLVVPLFW